VDVQGEEDLRRFRPNLRFVVLQQPAEGRERLDRGVFNRLHLLLSQSLKQFPRHSKHDVHSKLCPGDTTGIYFTSCKFV
jgi:hypothetical protein